VQKIQFQEALFAAVISHFVYSLVLIGYTILSLCLIQVFHTFPCDIECPIAKIAIFNERKGKDFARLYLLSPLVGNTLFTSVQLRLYQTLLPSSALKQRYMIFSICRNWFAKHLLHLQKTL